MANGKNESVALKNTADSVDEAGASGIAEIVVAGFKSIYDEQRIEVRPLTILAGANSSGKSSMLQPLLLLKQTLEASYDAGPLQLNGPNVRFSSTEQLLSRIGKQESSGSFRVGMRLSGGEQFQTTFRKESKRGFTIEQMEISDGSQHLVFWPDMTRAEIADTGITQGLNLSKLTPKGYDKRELKILRDRCFIGPVWEAYGRNGSRFSHGLRPGPRWEEIVPYIIHLPSLRGMPERTYPVTAVGNPFVGTFEKYTASVISLWADENHEKLHELNDELKQLELTGGVSAIRRNDVQIELFVGRLPSVRPTTPNNRVNIADVGIGVSQLLPVLVALHAAKSGQVVYIEQPETHLHPRAQFALARIFASAVGRGVRVIVETHSSILLLGIQTLVAKQSLNADIVKLHWFQRDKDGRTIVRSSDLDDAGRFGDWPQDFDDVTLEAQKSYLDAADCRLFVQ